MPTGREDLTTESQLTAEDNEGDLDMTVRESGLDAKGRTLIDWVKPHEWLLPDAEVYEEWEEDEQNQDVDFMDLYDSEKEDRNAAEDSDEIYGEELIKKGEEEDEAILYLNYSHSALSTRGYYRDTAENRFWTSTQEIGERLLRWAMTCKDFFTSSEDQQDRIEHIIIRRKQLIAGNASLIIELESAAREDAEEQGIHLQEMDKIDCEMNRHALLNLSRQQFPRSIKQEPEN
ncbi:hypothetical protein B9Z19DRAFT_1120410 [Tuber borchii]|uniref:Uncharacterized protein n=1 Tax=Tuber borchii TaxID=42251 RepID=A0A2T7A4J5_TUBBO|nr:hypothetical protein B9Z19DRAFT_1120410 [Tuber borchii]